MSESKALKEQAFTIKNVRLFLWFRIFFNCRFYYPVLAVFFIDLGLTLPQYIMLNVIWAATIVLLEVPSGALADIIGRKRLVVGSAIIMAIEMALLLFAPIGGAWFLFSVCAINRVLAGIAEAAASGADEALAYDSLTGKDKDKQWDEVLSSLGKRYGIFMAVAMVTGALVYDPSIHHWLANNLGFPLLDKSLVIRIPVFLCFIQSLFAISIALRLTDSHESTDKSSIRSVFRQTWKASKWVWTTKTASLLLVGTMLTDAFTRNFATLTSSYYRYIHLPEFTFGFIGALISICSFAVPFYAKPIAQKLSLTGNILVVALTTTAGLWGLCLFRSPVGILPAILVMMSLYHTGFIASRFLNKLTSSEIRATVLSVKGLVFNLSYASFSIAFAQTLSWKKTILPTDQAFQTVLTWTPVFFIFMMLILFLPQAILSHKLKNR